jgi:hypothetical protein
MTAGFVLASGLLLAAGVEADTSIRMLREHGDSMNLQRVTLRGVVHLVSHRKQELGGTCGGSTFTLEDETGSVEIAVRRASRLVEPLREGDRVRVVAQVERVHNKDNQFLRTCILATEVEHLDR